MHLELVTLEVGQVLCEARAEMSHVYFPNDALVSLIAVAAGGKGLEVGMVGRGGLFGVPLLLGEAISPARALVQGTGTAMRLSARRFLAELRRSAPLHRAASRYASVSIATAVQIAACNNAHVVDERCARWLLMTSDNLGTNAFLLTQEILSQMVGVRRTGISEAASRLQKRGLVTYRRGKIVILDRAGLTAASCGCYGMIRNLSVPSPRIERRAAASRKRARPSRAR
jgi:CRP-like cAMP-binding protein